jgi:fatty-acyl-CoA synthase
MTGLISPPAQSTGSRARAWSRALERTAPIGRNPGRIFSAVIADLALEFGGAPALLSDRESLTYRGLHERANRYARWAIDKGLGKGDVVGLLMTNRPEYMAAWLGVTNAGCVVSLLNTHLPGPSLAHCINIVSPKHLIVAAEFAAPIEAAVPALTSEPEIWFHGPGTGSYPRIDTELELLPGDDLTGGERRLLTIEDQALFIYTSGTTGLPKAARVSHARIMQWSQWFAGMMGVQPTDRMYTCLPMYHSVGGVLAPGAALAGGASVVVREKFSTSHFWTDIQRWDCTMFQYIGELCRYLLNSEPAGQDAGHRIRIACGNGLAPGIWEAFQSRFRIPQIFEFYASTEGGVSLFNVEGKPGAIGHVPAYLAHRFSPALVRVDQETGQPVRNAQGFCLRCTVNEAGEAIGKVVNDPSQAGSRFEGYTSEAASEAKLLRNVFEQGDLWVRTGDLMRKDEKGYLYFVDRIGDTFRWKGENVSTSEVAEAICSFPGIRHANVYGVAIPGAEGRAGMAAIVIEHELDLEQFREHLCFLLPSYARPLFLKIRQEVELTGTFKYSKSELLRQGYDPGTGTDRIYFDHPELKTLLPLDQTLYDRIQGGHIRL